MDRLDWLRMKNLVVYYWRRFVLFFGICPRCGCRVNYTSYGREICPNGCKW